MTAPLATWTEAEGRILRLRLARPKANIIDAAMIAALDTALTDAAGDAALTAVILDTEGPHFSFGASVEEHLPAQCAEMLAALHALVRRMLDYPVPILVAVQGQCLGGGLEVAMAGGLIFAAPDAQLGQPEIRIGVFAPAASCLLPARIGQAAAEEMLWSGRSIGAEEARELGLVTRVADDPAATAADWAATHLLPKSASSLRQAVRAVRAGYAATVASRLAE
ncbi:MAG: cyclohexa-1,5-dienecarbonyl-CoA hydratase, partial [Alphaproteobacteria bacterium HGW-Alphaproteobacteria-2]